MEGEPPLVPLLPTTAKIPGITESIECIKIGLSPGISLNSNPWPVHSPAWRSGGMIINKTFIICLSVLLWSAPLLASTKVASVRVEKGEVTVLRGGKPIPIAKGNNRRPIDINQIDLVRVGKDSLARIRTKEKWVDLIMGSHGMVLFDDWQRGEKQGLVRIVYGRVRVEAFKLLHFETFDLVAGMAAIRVNRAAFVVFQGAGGATAVAVDEGEVFVKGKTGEDVKVGAGEISLVTDEGATPASKLNDAYKQLMKDNQLNAVDVESGGSESLPDEAGLVLAGVISPDALTAGKNQVAPETMAEIDAAAAADPTSPLPEPPPPPEPETIYEMVSRLPVTIDVER